MAVASKRRITYNKIRLALFLHSHSAYVISQLLITKNKYYKKLTPKSINRLSEVLNLDLKALKSYFILGKYPRLIPKPKGRIKYIVDKTKVFTFLEVEKEIISLIIEKQDLQTTTLEDYNRALVEPAIERVTGNHLCNIEDDQEFENQFEELKSKFCRCYYLVTRNYRLPTPGLTPFILRLIGN